MRGDGRSVVSEESVERVVRESTVGVGEREYGRSGEERGVREARRECERRECKSVREYSVVGQECGGVSV